MTTDPDKTPCAILYLIGQLHSGGSERQLYYLLREIDRSRYRPALVVWNFCETDIYLAKIRDLGVPVYSFPTGLSGTAKLLALRRVVKRLRPKIVHSFSFYLNFAAHWSVKGMPTIAFGSMRSVLDLDKQINGLLLGRLSARLPHNQIYNSLEAAATVKHSKSLFTPRHVFVVRNGVDLESFPVSHLSNLQRPKILGVGSLVAVKRWDRLLIAASELKRRNIEFSASIIGDGPLRRTLEQKICELGVRDCIQLRGYSDDIQSFMSDATFLVHCSEAEGCPNVVMEAMACGRGVVATDVGDTPSLIDDSVTGFLVRSGDDRMLIQRMTTLLSDSDLCRRMGEAARAKAEREFGLPRMVENTLAVYRAAGAIESSTSSVYQSYFQNSAAE